MKRTLVMILTAGLLTGCAQELPMEEELPVASSAISSSSVGTSSTPSSQEMSSAVEEASSEVPDEEEPWEPPTEASVRDGSYRRDEYKLWRDTSQYTAYEFPLSGFYNNPNGEGTLTFQAPEGWIIGDGGAGVLSFQNEQMGDYILKIGEFQFYYKVKPDQPFYENDLLAEEQSTLTGESSLRQEDTNANQPGAYQLRETYYRFIDQIGSIHILNYIVDLGNGCAATLYFYVSQEATPEDLSIYDGIVASMGVSVDEGWHPPTEEQDPTTHPDAFYPHDEYKLWKENQERQTYQLEFSNGVVTMEAPVDWVLEKDKILMENQAFHGGPLEIGEWKFYPLESGVRFYDSPPFDQMRKTSPVTGDPLCTQETQENLPGAYWRAGNYFRYVDYGPLGSHNILNYIVDLKDGNALQLRFRVSRQAGAEDLKIYDAIVDSIQVESAS